MSDKKRKFLDELTQDFGTDKTKSPEAIIALFETLTYNVAWLEAKRVFEKKIQDLTDKITDTDTQGRELERLRDRRDLLIYFVNLPEIIISYQRQGGQPKTPDFDPYEKLDTKPAIDL